MNKNSNSALKKTIWAHAVIRNEENFIWFALMSVIDYVDKILIYDLGSSDETVKIIKSIKSDKIKLREFEANTNMVNHANMRQAQLDENKGDWILILDGDEIWLESSIQKVVETIQTNGKIDCIVVPNFMLVGDIYHYQENQAGEYNIAGKIGHYNMRAINSKTQGLHIEIHPNNQGLLREGFFNKEGKHIYEDSSKTVLIDAPYLHASHLTRSSEDEKVVERSMRFKYELGERFPKDFNYPKSLFLKYPEFVKNPWTKRGRGYLIKAAIQTPFKKIKRRYKRK